MTLVEELTKLIRFDVVFYFDYESLNDGTRSPGGKFVCSGAYNGTEISFTQSGH